MGRGFGLSLPRCQPILGMNLLSLKVLPGSARATPARKRRCCPAPHGPLWRTAALLVFLAGETAGWLTATAVAEPLGQSSRRTGLVLSEIMYHPPSRADGRKLEFIELYNSLGTPEDLGGYRLSGDTTYIFPANTVLQGGAFLVVARSPADLQIIYGLTNVCGPYSDSLPNDSGTVRLQNAQGAILIEARYGSTQPWPVAADGAGHSLVLACPSHGEADARAWAASDGVGGSPGRADPVTPDPLRAVVINELLARSVVPDLDFIELYNHSSREVDISGCVLTDDAEVNRFVFPRGTVVPAGGFLAIDEFILGFGLSADGETVYFRNPTGTRILDAVRFDAQASEVAWGRYPDGAPNFQELTRSTPLAPNAPALTRDIVINEIMYAPLSGNTNDQYIELYNQGTNVVDVSGWAFVDGIDFTFPAGTVIPPDGYLVVAKNAARMAASDTNLGPANLVGDFSGTLSRHGERIALARLETTFTTNSLNEVSTNRYHLIEDEVTYGSGGHWGRWANAGGSSLELIDPRSDNRLAPNWADSDETAKAPWTNIEVTGVLENGIGSADSLQIILLGAGECLVDNVEVLNADQVNLIANSTFQDGGTGWTAEGTHETSSAEVSEGYDDAASYRLRAVTAGDNEVNHIRALLSAAPTPGSIVTIRAKVRWLRGAPEILFRLRGNWLEAAGRLPVPANPGTPGRRNSRAVAKAPPAISDVSHSPVLPAAGQPVLITARAHTPDSIAQVEVRYRIDPAAEWTSIAMKDDGTGGDAIANDGLFSAMLPAQPAGSLAAFFVQATDGHGGSATFPNDAPARECLVRWGETEPAGALPTYRLWMTQATLQTWTNRHPMNRAPLDVTFVAGSHRVIYTAGALYEGDEISSTNYDSPTGKLCGYAIHFPPDEPFLGSTELVIDWPGGSRPDTTALQEQTAAWIAGRMQIPLGRRFFIHLHVNGVTEAQRGGIFEAVLNPGPDLLDAWYPESQDAELFKIDRAFERSARSGLSLSAMPTLQDFTTTGRARDTIRYRWNWRKREGSSANDYTNFFRLVGMVNAAAYAPCLAPAQELLDVSEWMRVFAFEHMLNNFESYGHAGGTKMFACKPAAGKWQLLPAGFDQVMLLSAEAGYSATSGLFTADDPAIGRLYANPAFRRVYWRVVQEAVEGPLRDANVNPFIDAMHQWLEANGVTAGPGQPLGDPAAVKSWLQQRRDYLLSQLAGFTSSFAITGTNNITTDSNLVTLTGTAPISLTNITVNGVSYPPTWLSETNWRVSLALNAAANYFSIIGYDSRGAPVTLFLSVAYIGPIVRPQDAVVINEIMYHPPADPGAAFVELFNTSTNFAFDLSGWSLAGEGSCLLPSGAVLLPRQFGLLVKDRLAFAATYGQGLPVLAECSCGWGRQGETLVLRTASGKVADKVKYEAQPPWPRLADGLGASLQLVDPAQDHARVSNWSDGSGGLLATPGAPNPVTNRLPAYPLLWLNELQSRNLSTRADHLGHFHPWLELYNSGTSNLYLDGFFLANDYAALDQWAFPAGAWIGPGERKIIWTDGLPGESTATEWHTSFAIASSTGSVTLARRINDSPQILDYLNYPSLDTNSSYGDYPDGQLFDRRIFQAATPAAPNGPLVFINEWMADNSDTLADPADGLFHDWFELYNASPNPADLSGMLLSDSTDQTWPIPDGWTIPPHGFLLVWADDEPDQNKTPSVDLHVPFQLSKKGDGIRLYARAGALLDSVTFGQQRQNVSQGRYPDGGWGLYSFLAPTPRAPNSTNAPPVITFPGDKTVVLGQTLSFQVAATDPQSPPQLLTFALEPGAPAGAIIDSNSGVFTWTPAAAQAPSLNLLKVRVTDNGTPSLSATTTFTVTLLLPTKISEVRRVSGTRIVLSWQANPGKTYQVEFKRTLSDAAWLPLGNAVVAAGSSLSFTADIGTDPQRFYRIVQTD